MDTIQEGDLIVIEPDTIGEQRVLASTRHWDGIDQISVEQRKRLNFSEPTQARVTSVSLGRVTAVPDKSSGQKGLSVGKFTCKLTTLVDGHPGKTNPLQGLNKILVPAGSLGDTVTAVIYQIRDDTAYGEIKEIKETGLSEGDKVSVTVHRQKETGTLDIDGLDDLEVSLDQSVLIGGEATVELSKIKGSLAGRVVDLDFIPQVGDRFQMRVVRNSDEATPHWSASRGVDSVLLQNEAVATDEALVELTEVGKCFKGKIIDYTTLPGVGEKAPIQIRRSEKKGVIELDGLNNPPVVIDQPVLIGGRATAEITSLNECIQARIVDLDFIPQVGDRYNMQVRRNSLKAVTDWDDIRGIDTINLSQEAIGTDEAVIEITEVGEVFRGRVVGYANAPKNGETVNAILSKHDRNAQTISREYEVILDEPAELSGKASVKIHTTIDFDAKVEPPHGKIRSYHQLPEQGDTVITKIGGDNSIAYTYKDDNPIHLSGSVSESGFAKVTVTNVQKAELTGKVKQFGLNNKNNNEKYEKDIDEGNPFGLGSSSRNDDITGRKL